MRRLLPLSLLGALLCLALTGAPALAEVHHHGAAAVHHRHHHHAAKKVLGHSKESGKATSGKASDSGTAVLNDCQAHGQLTKSYTKAALKQALAEMSATSQQYSDCGNVIRQALVNIAGGGSGGGGSGSSTTMIVVIIVVVLVVLAAIFGGLAVRRRRGPAPQ